jgi:hypothetical protein
MKPTAYYGRQYGGTGAAHNKMVWRTDLGLHTTDELAEMLEISPSAVRQRWMRCKNLQDKEQIEKILFAEPMEGCPISRFEGNAKWHELGIRPRNKNLSTIKSPGTWEARL